MDIPFRRRAVPFLRAARAADKWRGRILTALLEKINIQEGTPPSLRLPRGGRMGKGRNEITKWPSGSPVDGPLCESRGWHLTRRQDNEPWVSTSSRLKAQFDNGYISGDRPALASSFGDSRAAIARPADRKKETEEDTKQEKRWRKKEKDKLVKKEKDKLLKKKKDKLVKKEKDKLVKKEKDQLEKEGEGQASEEGEGQADSSAGEILGVPLTIERRSSEKCATAAIQFLARVLICSGGKLPAGYERQSWEMEGSKSSWFSIVSRWIIE
ncbi:hypothetical protein KM043_003560 [Ampulex compressa]|nr:hypothetical protein KM043_003560 [Ampulex compressa]